MGQVTERHQDNSCRKVNRAGTAGEVRMLTPEEAYEKLKDTERWKVIDVRSYEEHRNVRIDPSVLVPLETVEDRLPELSRMSENLILLCGSGPRSYAVAGSLSATCMGNAYVIEGGMVAWNKAKLPVERTGPAFTLQRQIQTIAGTMILTGAILSLTINAWWVLLCLWVGLGLTFAGITGTCPMALLLLKMPWNKIDAKASQEKDNECSMGDCGCCSMCGDDCSSGGSNGYCSTC